MTQSEAYKIIITASENAMRLTKLPEINSEKENAVVWAALHAVKNNEFTQPLNDKSDAG